MKRRQVLTVGGVAALGLSHSSIAQAKKKTTYEWKMVLPWPKQVPGLGTTMQSFVEQVKKGTSGRMNIHLYGAGELVKPHEVFDAVSKNIAQMGHGPAHYWNDRVPGAELFTALPFGLTPLELNAWMYNGGGIALLTKLYKPYGVLPLPCGNSDFQMGGWFNRPINSIDDIKGLNVRILGIGAEIYRRLGATPVNLPNHQIKEAFKAGRIDAADTIAPWQDQAAGIQEVAKYYYGSWHEPGASSELMINQQAFDKLPTDIQTQIRTAAKAAGLQMLLDFRTNNAKALKKLIANDNIKIQYFPEAVIKRLKKENQAYLAELADSNDVYKEILNSYQQFLSLQKTWSENEQHYLSVR